MNEKELRELDAEIHKICGWIYDSSRHAWQRNGFWTAEPGRYTEGENFQEVLEKCAKRLSPDGGGSAIAVEWLGDIEESWRVIQTDVSDGVSTEAKTLPIGICLFAKKLDTK